MKMAFVSLSVKTGNWTLECAAEIYTKQTNLSNDYELFHRRMF